MSNLIARGTLPCPYIEISVVIADISRCQKDSGRGSGLAMMHLEFKNLAELTSSSPAAIP